MKRNIVIRFWVVIGILALAGSASGALSGDEQVKMLAERYGQIEDFVQLLANKWSSDACVGGKIDPGPKFAGSVDVMKALAPKIYAFVKKHFDPEEGGSLSFHINKVSNDGTIDLEASEFCASGDCKGETRFAVGERLRLRETAGASRVDILNMRRLPNEP
jgi:hypothetical protein